MKRTVFETGRGVVWVFVSLCRVCERGVCVHTNEHDHPWALLSSRIQTASPDVCGAELTPPFSSENSRGPGDEQGWGGTGSLGFWSHYGLVHLPAACAFIITLAPQPACRIHFHM